MAASHMEHKAEADGQDQIEAPGDGSPVENRVGAGPNLDGAQLLKMGIIGIEDPFTEGVKQDIGRQPGGKHHAAPGKVAVFWFFIWLAETDGPIF